MRRARSRRLASMSTRANVPPSRPSTASTSVMIWRAKTALPAPIIVTLGIKRTLAPAIVAVLLAAAIVPTVQATAVNGLKVVGNRLADSAGRPLMLRGANRSGTEYACIQGWGIFDGPSDDASVQAIAS